MIPFPRRLFYLIRHGESVANKKGYAAGWLDSRLTALGRAQARQSGIILDAAAIQPEILVASTLRRAAETAEILNKVAARPLIHDRRLWEQNYGVFQGRYRCPRSTSPEWQKEPLGGETFEKFTARIAGRISWRLQRDRRLPAFICHGGVMGALSESLTGIRMRGIGNCAIFLFEPPRQRLSTPWKIHVLKPE